MRDKEEEEEEGFMEVVRSVYSPMDNAKSTNQDKAREERKEEKK